MPKRPPRKPPKQLEFNLNGGRTARDHGMNRVAEHNKIWMDAVIRAVILPLPQGWRGQMEDIRPLAEDAAGKPTHPNIYGALTNKLIRAQILRHTDERRQMKKQSSHARDTALLERV